MLPGLLTPLSHLQLALKKPLHKQHLGQADPDRGKVPKRGQKGTTKAPQAPVAGAQQQGKGLLALRANSHCLAPPALIRCPSSAGAAKQKPTATKQQPKAKPVSGGQQWAGVAHGVATP